MGIVWGPAYHNKGVPCPWGIPENPTDWEGSFSPDSTSLKKQRILAKKNVNSPSKPFPLTKARQPKFLVKPQPTKDDIVEVPIVEGQQASPRH